MLSCVGLMGAGILFGGIVSILGVLLMIVNGGFSWLWNKIKRIKLW